LNVDTSPKSKHFFLNERNEKHKEKCVLPFYSVAAKQRALMVKYKRKIKIKKPSTDFPASNVRRRRRSRHPILWVQRPLSFHPLRPQFESHYFCLSSIF
jgi:hypothetical protein